jgi:hypothetical protein
VRLGNWLTAEQAQALWQAPDRGQVKGKRDRALLALLLACGLRRHELAGLTIDHLQQRQGHWAIVDLRGKAACHSWRCRSVGARVLPDPCAPVAQVRCEDVKLFLRYSYQQESIVNVWTNDIHDRARRDCGGGMMIVSEGVTIGRSGKASQLLFYPFPLQGTSLTAKRDAKGFSARPMGLILGFSCKRSRTDLVGCIGVRPERHVVLAGGCPVRVSARAPGSRLQPGGEIRLSRAECQ